MSRVWLFENAVALKHSRESFDVRCGPTLLESRRENFVVYCGLTRLKSKLVDAHVMFGYWMIVKKKKNYAWDANPLLRAEHLGFSILMK